MATKILKGKSPYKIKLHQDKLNIKESQSINDVNELQKELKSKNIKFFELKNKYHDQNILLKFFLNNAENLDDLLIIEKQVRKKDEQIEQIRKELNDTKVNNENLVENMKKNFNEQLTINDTKKEKEKNEFENIINKKDEDIKKLENEIKKNEVKIKIANEKIQIYEKIKKEKNSKSKNKNDDFIQEIKK